MGRYYGYGWKTTTDGLIYIDTASLKRLGYLQGWARGSLEWTRHPSEEKSSIFIEVNVALADKPYARLIYWTLLSGDEEKSKHDYFVRLTSTACNFGGIRWWFECPLAKQGIVCGRRSRRLYKYGRYFGCRQCLKLTYSSQNENPAYRYGAFRVISDEIKADQLGEEIKVPYYKGRPTRKMRRYIKLRQNAEDVASAWVRIETFGRKEL